MNKYFRLALVSFVILFLELLLIRLIGTEIRIFAYLSNLILWAAFVGSGVGMLSKFKFSPRVSVFLLLVTVLIINTGIFSGITDLLAPLNENRIWFQPNTASIGGIIAGLIMTAILFFLVLFIFVPLGKYLGGFFENSDRIILVYSINIAASILGMWAFYGLSFFSVTPFAGIVLAQVILILLTTGGQKYKILMAMIVLITAAVGVGARDDSVDWLKTVWSPYQKLSVYKYPKEDPTRSGYYINVNGATYMGLYDFSDSRRAWIEKKIKERPMPSGYDVRFADQYRLPYIMKPDAQNILIVGAGGGNDAAAAARAGVNSVDAVEIDPQIINLGRKYHPESPYSSPNVNVIIDDGRSFFRRTDKKYDLIVMGLADSHTLSSSLTNIRLDHYLYTQESFEEIKKILKPDGLLYLSFEVAKNTRTGNKISKNLKEIFGSGPVVFELRDTQFFGLGGVMFLANKTGDVETKYIDQNIELKKFIESRRVNYETDSATLSDNWPYLYLDWPKIPRIHLWISLFLVVAFLVFRKVVSWQSSFLAFRPVGLSASSPAFLRWDFFALGAGFLLYEFQNVSKTSLLFGNTWATNLFTITAILLFILLANIVQSRFRFPIGLAYAGIIAAFAVQFLVPIESFNSLPFYSKAILGSLFLNLPLFFSAILFITLLRDAQEKSAAFASNLIGSAAGGLFESLSFLWGIQALMLVALAFYLISIPLVLRRR